MRILSLKKSPKEINLFFLQRTFSYMFFKEKATVEVEKTVA
jgi:hypothetical protein